MVLDSLLAGIVLFSSYAIRTPNVQPNPDDYEVSVGIQYPHEHHGFYVNRQWERELGHKYIDDLVWFKLENSVYFKPEYMNKESKDVKYLKIDWRNKWNDWSFGFTTRSTTDELDTYETFVSFGTAKKRLYGEKVEIEFSFDGYIPADKEGGVDLRMFEFEDKFKVSYQITENVRLYNLGEIFKLKGREFYRAKIGLEVSF